MNPILVCPPDEGLLGSLAGQQLIVRLDAPVDLVRSASMARVRNTLRALWMELDVPLYSLSLPEGVELLPLSLHVREMGPLHRSLPLIRSLKASAVRIFLPSQCARSYSDCRILSSLGVRSGIWMRPGQVDWDRLDDLMHYAVYGKAPHAPIEPFETMMSEEPFLAPDIAFFEDPTRYLHVAADGRVALSRNDLEEGVFVGTVGSVGAVAGHPRFLARVRSKTERSSPPETNAKCAKFYANAAAAAAAAKSRRGAKQPGQVRRCGWPL
ncbi:MAG: hypothetical protein PHF00_01840 [Elusimicrobia bacterium]|nr:hypothetical protein [Elusimicrobiota bacterium]